MKKIILLSLFALGGCNEHFRYPCQDPVNFGKEDCIPPACLATGTCTEDLIGKKIVTTEVEGE